MNNLFKQSFFVLIVLGLTACGFHLRQSPPLPEGIEGVSITAPNLQSKLARALSSRLKIYQLSEITNQEKDTSTVHITLQPEDLERRLLSIFSTGQVAEYELIYSVNYTVSFPDASPVNGYVEVLREYQDDPDQVLAKSRELEVVLSEVRQEAADRIIRLLSSQAP